MNTDFPLAYFITWTIYGVHLQGAAVGWRKRGKGQQPAQPLLEAWHCERLNHSIEVLSATERNAVEAACRSHSEHRNWKLWAVNARSNHVHVVVTALTHKGTVVRDQLKANCTKSVREANQLFVDRPVWAVGGDVQFIWNEDELGSVIDYTLIAQERKDRDSSHKPMDHTTGPFRICEPTGASPGSQPFYYVGEWSGASPGSRAIFTSEPTGASPGSRAIITNEPTGASPGSRVATEPGLAPNGSRRSDHA